AGGPLRACGRGTHHLPARPASLRRHPPAGRRCGSAQCAGAARTLVTGEHPDLHPRLYRAPPGGVPPGPSPGVTARPRRVRGERRVGCPIVEPYRSYSEGRGYPDDRGYPEEPAYSEPRSPEPGYAEAQGWYGE